MTKRPWIFYELIGGDYGISPEHDETRAIATVFESSHTKEDAKLIVNAVNSYSNIISLAKEAKDALEHTIKFLRYQKQGKEFYPNREGAEALILKLSQIISNSEVTK